MNNSTLTSLKKGARLVASLSFAILLGLNSVAGAQARILFQDDSFADVVSEGLIINSDDGGDEDVTFQLGNDGSDATFIFDDGTGDLSITTPGGDIDFGDENLSTTGGLAVDGDVDFTDADSVHIQESTDPTTLVGCAITGEIILDTTDNEIQICTATGADAVAAVGSVIVTAGTGGDTYQVTVNANIGSVVPFNTSLAQTAIDIASDITNNVTGYSASAVGTTITITADVGGTSGNGTVSTAVTGTAATTDNNTTGGLDGTATWTTIAAGDASTLDGIDSTQFLRSDTSDNFTSGTLTTDAGTTVDVNGVFDASGSTGFQIREDSDPATNAACASVGEIILDTTDNEIQVCTVTGGAGAATWVNVASGSVQDFESVYSADGDSTLTASGTFDIDATGAVGIDSDAGLTLGGAGISLTSDGGVLSLTGDGTNDIDLSNAGAALDFDAGSFDVLTTGGISLDAGAASNLTTSAGDLTLEATAGSTNVNGGEAAVDAVRINASNAAGGIDVDAGTGGIAIDTTGALSIDSVGTSNITNDTGDLTIETTTSGDLNLTGAGDIVFDDGTLTGTITLSDTDTDWDATFSSDGIIDNINSFASTATGEGASNVGIEDAGSYFTGTDVEAALQELGADAARNNDVLTFYPEYPNTVVSQDGSNNKGKLVSEYDAVGDRNYYEWTSKNGSLNDIDLYFRFELPADWTDTNDFTIDFQTGTAVAGENAFDVTLVNITDSSTTCASSTTNVNTSWTTITLAEASIETGCTGGTLLDAGDIVEVQIKLYSDNTGAAFARAGQITWSYDN